MSAPLVTVVVTAYNQERVVADSVRSALGQTHPRTEVVVVDDGSTDGTADVVAALGADRLVRQPNGGVCAARNAGAEHAQGELLCFLDGDDVLRPDAVSTGLQHLRDAGADFAIGRSQLVGADGRPLPTTVLPAVPQHDLYRRMLAQCWVVPPGVVLIRRSALDAVGPWDTTLTAGGDDLDVFLRLARTQRGVDHTDVVCDYRLHASNRSATYAPVLADNMRVLEAQKPHTAGDPGLERARRQGVRHYQRVFGTKAALAEAHTALRQRRGVLRAGATAAAAAARHPVLVSQLLCSQVVRRGAR
jgi:glycosyltransferase involved in cell wall biosynthesis